MRGHCQEYVIIKHFKLKITFIKPNLHVSMDTKDAKDARLEPRAEYEGGNSDNREDDRNKNGKELRLERAGGAVGKISVLLTLLSRIGAEGGIELA